MPLYIFKKLFKNMTEEQLERSIKGNINLKTYNRTHITQLGTCAVLVKFKNLKKQCVFFVVPGNGQALLRMPDMAALNIINLNFDSIQVEIAECKTNRGQETHAVAEACANMDAGAITKQNANGQNDQHNSNKSTNYFYSSNNIDTDKRKSSAMTQKIHNTFGNVFNGMGASKAHFHCSLSPTASHTKCHPGIFHMYYKNHSRRSWTTFRKWTSLHPLE